MFFNLKVDRTEWDVGRNGEWSERGGTKGTGGREREGKPLVWRIVSSRRLQD